MVWEKNLEFVKIILLVANQLQKLHGNFGIEAFKRFLSYEMKVVMKSLTVSSLFKIETFKNQGGNFPR